MASVPIVSKVPRDVKAIALAYNRPKGAQPIRVVNTLASSSVLDPKRVKKYPLFKGQKQWRCPECDKQLSSKRSFNEHMNIHTRQRPFQCDGCEYAAASQMTLRRHILRNHTSPTDWGYKCPYCTSSYMEPASYQQHVQTRHSGRSCTYGCPFVKCTFTTKCYSHFKIHFTKHGSADKISGPDLARLRTFSDEQLQYYVIDDDCGEGYRPNRPIAKREKPITISPIKMEAPIRQTLPIIRRHIPLTSDNYYGREDYMKQPLQIRPRQTKIIVPKERKVTYVTQVTSDATIMPADDDWIINEVEITSDPMLSDGQKDFDLD